MLYLSIAFVLIFVLYLIDKRDAWKGEAGGPSLHCTIPTEAAPSLRFLQGWAAMLSAQLLSVLHRPFCMPSSYPHFAKYAKDGAPAAVVAYAV